MEPPPENVGHQKSKNPQERSGTIKILSILDTTEKLVQEKIQVVGIKLVKQNNSMGICQPRQEAGVNIWEEKPPL